MIYNILRRVFHNLIAQCNQFIINRRIFNMFMNDHEIVDSLNFDLLYFDHTADHQENFICIICKFHEHVHVFI